MAITKDREKIITNHFGVNLSHKLFLFVLICFAWLNSSSSQQSGQSLYLAVLQQSPPEPRFTGKTTGIKLCLKFKFGLSVFLSYNLCAVSGQNLKSWRNRPDDQWSATPSQQSVQVWFMGLNLMTRQWPVQIKMDTFHNASFIVMHGHPHGAVFCTLDFLFVQLFLHFGGIIVFSLGITQLVSLSINHSLATRTRWSRAAIQISAVNCKATI